MNKNNNLENLISQQNPFPYKKRIFTKITTSQLKDENGCPITVTTEEINENKEIPNSEELSLNQKKINVLEHNQKIIIKLLEDIKSHLWSEPTTKSSHPITQSESQEYDAVSYIHKIVIPNLIIEEKEKGELVAQSAWIEWVAQPVLNYLKT